MKRILGLVMATALVLGTVCSASATEFKVKGQWTFAFGWGENVGPAFADSDNQRQNDPFLARMRIRPQIDIIASENLSGTLMFEIGDITFGRGGANGRSSGGALDSDGVNIETKRAYLDWMVPGTALSVRMGVQGLALPSGTGLNSPVFATDAAGVVASYKFNDTVSLTALWVRAFDAQDNDGNDNSLDDETDIFGLILPISLDGVKITPWATYAMIGNSSGFWGYRLAASPANMAPARDPYGNTNWGGDTEGWHAGVALTAELIDNLTFGFDAIYGDVHGNGTEMFWGTNDGNPGSRGWFVDANLNYKLDWGTPGLFGWWSSGDNANDLRDGKFGRMPTVANDTGFAPTDFGFESRDGLITHRKVLSSSGVGMWGVGAQIKDLSFVENLSHIIRVAYYRGTNESGIVKQQAGNRYDPRFFSEGQYMTTEDWAVEVNFNHKYQIYENLAAFLELGYIHMDLDEDVWNNSYRGYGDTEDAWKAQVAFMYNF